MAREFAKIKSAIWQDDDFRGLPPLAQHLYFVILTDPELSYCGIADWRPRRMLPKSQGWTLDELYGAAEILAQELLLIVDEDTEEVLVRSFLRHDGVMQHNKLCVSAMRSFAAVASNTLRGVIVHELNRLKEENPDWPSWDRQPVIEVLKRNALAPELAPNLAPRSAPDVAATPGAGLASALQQQQQQQPTTATTPKGVSAETESNAVTLPADWMPTKAHAERAKETGLNLMSQAEDFRLHAETHNRKAVNWNSAFTTWLKKSAERLPKGQQQQIRTQKPALQQWVYY